MRSIVFAILTFFSIANAFADTEPNNSWQTALTLPQDRTVAGTQSDDDWYVINAVVGNRILIDLTFTHTDGNIDMAFYGDDFVISNPAAAVPGIFRDISNSSTTDHEFIDHNISARGLGAYYIKVSGGSLGNSYTLTWTVLAAVDDSFEENDSNAATTAITEGVIALGTQADEDWYSIEVNSGNTRVLASLRFYNTELAKTIDLDLELRDTGGNLLAPSANASGINEAINHDVGAPGTYHLRVLGDNNGDGYALNWEGVSSNSSAVFPVPAYNEVPTATANTVTTTENTPYNFAVTDFTYSDSEGDSLVSATLTSLSLGGGALTHSGGTAVNNADMLTAAQLATLVYTPAVDASGSPLATFDFTVNDVDVGTVAAQMDIDVTATTTTTQTTTGGSSGSISLVGLFALMLIGVARRVYR